MGVQFPHEIARTLSIDDSKSEWTVKLQTEHDVQYLLVYVDEPCYDRDGPSRRSWVRARGLRGLKKSA